MVEMDKKIREFKSGRNNWLVTEVGVENGEIVIKNEIGRVSIEPDSVSELITGLQEAQREIDREVE